MIIPVYNVEKFLRKCIDSVIFQTFNDIEILLIDDGSTDRCGEICDEFAENDPRIRVIHKQNGGLSDARNTGIKNSRGKYIMFLDSDDWIDKDTCYLAITAAEQYAADLVFWSYVKEYETQSIPKQVYDTSEDHVIFDKLEVKKKLHRRIVGLYKEELRNPENMDSLVTACVKMYKSEIIKKHNLLFEDTKKIGTEDMLFNLYAISHVRKAVFINKELYHYRRDNQNSLTRKLDHTLYFKWKNLFSIVRRYLENGDYDVEFYEAFENRICLSFVGLGMNIVKDSNLTFAEKIKQLGNILSDSEYINAYKKLDLGYFDPKWRTFFLFAKYGIVFPLYMMLKIMIKATSR
jgi:glycosyltransferase involved in cell wall biosynthesis